MTTLEERKTLARGWRSSGLPQAAYSEQHGISDRTLRLWISRYAPPAPQSPAEVQRVLQCAIAALNALLAASLAPAEFASR